ncbi:cytochrome c biogenesis protein CcsA [Pollutibacter soli]|uniref:cytochrome c biogenesis protein CcsA n=1 Tax=Pollutibacter soli TaxID=3034157 RepID=UPI003013D509
MPYEGEHLVIGQIGHFVALLAFAASLVATMAFYKSTVARTPIEAESWKKMGRTAFVLNAIAVFAIFITLYLIIYNHYFEYKYAHQHSKRSLDMQYLLSCFWEGQEGSFMLWSFWNSVIGLVLLRTAKQWEAPVMTMASLVQLFLATFLTGIYFFDVRLGSSPFVLMRNEFPDAEIFKDPQYLIKYLRDGNGLNILLQNYWMVIHPPIVFLGFASSLVPFAYAVAGLWKNDHKGWISPAMPWALFCGGVLGLGVMMGAAWAYESLTFGGYWAWDPVENASMVPWLTLVAGIHTMLIFRSTGFSLKATYLFIPISFLLVIYSTFLTRTGVLGDTSVHSFTGEGNSLYWHLLLMIGVFAAIPVILYIRRRKSIPVVRNEENMHSREFWMFVGSLLFFVAAIYVIILTSLPFINKLFGTQWAIGENVEYVYNRVMIMVALVITFLSAFGQFLKYKGTTRQYFISKIALPAIIAIVVSAIISFVGGIDYDRHGAGFLVAIHLCLWAAIFAAIANGAYIFSVLKGNLKAAGAAIAHVGFGMMIVGILISSANKELLSLNRTGIAMPGLKDAKGRDENPLENLTLIHGIPTPMGKYMVTYEGDSTEKKNNRVYFKIRFSELDSTGNSKKDFYVQPNAFLVKSGEGTNLSSNPGSKHYIHHDVFVYITSWLNPDNISDTATFRMRTVKAGDTVFYSNGFAVVNRIISANKYDNKDLPVVDSAWLSEVSVYAKDGREFQVQPAYFVKDNQPTVKTDTVISQSVIFNLIKKNSGEIQVGIKESDAVMRYITLKAFNFPMINLLWLGTIFMVIGFMVSMVYRFNRTRIG